MGSGPALALGLEFTNPCPREPLQVFSGSVVQAPNIATCPQSSLRRAESQANVNTLKPLEFDQAVQRNSGSLFLQLPQEEGKKKILCCFSLIYDFIFHFHQKGGKLLNARKLPLVHNDIATLRRSKNSHKTRKIMPTPGKIKFSLWRQTGSSRPMAPGPPR